MGKAKAQVAPPTATPEPPSSDLKKLQAKVAELRDTENEMETLTERLKTLAKKAFNISSVELPELMLEVGISSIGLPADGNLPAYDAKMASFYKANIAAGWEPERRNAGFKYLEKLKAGDLIKTEIVIMLPRDKRAEAKKLLKSLKKYSPEVSEAVHSGTLSAWLKERLKDGKAVDLDLIGGEVGTRVQLKPRKAD
jgi:hypothetical protein